VTPEFVTCEKGEWTLVAENVWNFSVDVQTPGSTVFFAYAMTGGAAPTLKSQGVPLRPPSAQPLPTDQDAPIDFYIWPDNQDTVVMVSIPGADPSP